MLLNVLVAELCWLLNCIFLSRKKKVKQKKIYISECKYYIQKAEESHAKRTIQQFYGGCHEMPKNIQHFKQKSANMDCGLHHFSRLIWICGLHHFPKAF